MEEILEKERIDSYTELLPHSPYTFPPFSLLKSEKSDVDEEQDREDMKHAYVLQETIRSFGVQVTIVNICHGPTYTRFEIKPDRNVRVSSIVSLKDDIRLRLAAEEVQIVAPIPGQSAIGIDIRNKSTSVVNLRDLLESRQFKSFNGSLPFVVGKDIAGKTIIGDIARMPHILVGGTTGAGQSTFMNTVILSLLYSKTPNDVQFLMIDTKIVELSLYRKIPHLILPVITDAHKASAALTWVIAEMEKRYKRLSTVSVKNLEDYNSFLGLNNSLGLMTDRKPLPRIVLVIEQLEDLIRNAGKEVEDAIVRLTQHGRSVGIHLIISTQRPSNNVITGSIKTNVPCRIAFSMVSVNDSRTILGTGGAEKLSRRGEMLYRPKAHLEPILVQGAYVSDEEISAVVQHIRDHNSNNSYK